ncbi:hypothetical protein [Dactylosporangium sp. NPDC000521]
MELSRRRLRAVAASTLGLALAAAGVVEFDAVESRFSAMLLG